jgi:uncharacterized tellurite resistance protein B-like protein
MSVLLRFLGLDAARRADEGEAGLDAIAAELDALDPERARFFAAFACVLARVAGADLRIEPAEVEAMEQTMIEIAGITPAEAGLAIRIANTHMERLGGSENFLVTREFRSLSSKQERTGLLHCLFAVAAADDLITGDESNEIMNIAKELGLTHEEALGVRTRFKDKLAEFRRLSGESRRDG